MTTRFDHRRGLTITVIGAVVGTLTAVGVGPVAASSPEYTSTVVATGLNNPRGVTVGANGRVYVTEAGLGSGNAQSGAALGLGNTGSITEIRRANTTTPRQRVLIGGLPSAANDEGQGPEVVGADGIYAVGSKHKVKLRVIIGAAGIPNSLYGHAVTVRVSSRTVKDIADVGSVNLAWTGLHRNDPWAPAGQFPDSNPYGIGRAGGKLYVVDAGANTLNRINSDGSVSIVAYFPNTAVSDAVPTCVAEGPDGALYIGTLALADFFATGPGASTVYRVDPNATNPDSLDTVRQVATPWATGFSTITGCTFDHEGNFYAAEMFANDVVKVPFSHPTSGRTIIGTGVLTLPNGVAVASNGNLFVSNMSTDVTAGKGSVVRFSPSH